MDIGILTAIVLFIGFMGTCLALEKIADALNASNEISRKATDRMAGIESQLKGLWVLESEKGATFESPEWEFDDDGKVVQKSK